MYELYIDVVFLINLIMDLLLMSMARRMMKAQTTMVRIVLGSAVGAAGACLVIVWPVFLGLGELILAGVVLGGLMVKIGFHTKGVQELARGILSLVFVSVTMGGLMGVLYQHTYAGYYVEQLIRGNTAEGMPLLIWLFLAAGSWYGCKYLWIFALEVKRRQQHLYQVTLVCKERSLTFPGFLDTGNHLHEPVSGHPVHVVSKAVWAVCYQEGDPICLIPYHTIGSEEGFMPGMFLESMKIQGEKECREIDRPLIAVSPHPVNRDGSYEILLNEED